MAQSKTDTTGWSHNFTIPGAVASGAAVAATLLSPQVGSGGSVMTQQKPMTATTPTTTQGSPFVDKDYVAVQVAAQEKLFAAKLETTEARTDSKFAELLGELKTLAVNVGHIDTTLSEIKTDVAGAKAAAAGTKTYVIGTGIAIAGFVLAIFAFGVQILDIATALFSAGNTK